MSEEDLLGCVALNAAKRLVQEVMASAGSVGWHNAAAPKCAADICDAIEAAVAEQRERCARIVDVPSGTEPWEVIGGEEGLTMLRELAAQIRGA